MRKRQELTWSQVVMAANTPMLLKAAMVDGRPDLGVMASGQVVGVIDDLPTVAELLDRIIDRGGADAARLDRGSERHDHQDQRAGDRGLVHHATPSPRLLGSKCTTCGTLLLPAGDVGLPQPGAATAPSSTRCR